MAGTTAYPGAIDNFAEGSPTNLGDSDATGRTHSERHDDVEAAVEAIEGELGTTPSGVYPTVADRLDAIAGAGAASISLGAGTANAPSFYFTGDTNTGVYSPGADTFAISTGGTERLRVGSAGQVTTILGSASAPAIAPTGDTNTGIWSPGADTLAVSTGGTERLRVDSSGRVGIGTSSPSTTLEVAGGSITHSRQAATTTYNMRRVNADNTAVANGDNIADVVGLGYDGSTYRAVGRIRMAVDGAPGSGDMPGRFSFYTTADGGTTENERMRIDNAGLITGTGTSLGAWTAWTPSLTATTTNPTLGTGSTIAGRYMRIGKMVVVQAQIKFGTSGTNAGSGQYVVSLPSGLNGVTTLGYPCIGSAWAYDASTGARRSMTVYLAGTTGVSIHTADALVTEAAPWAWAASDEFYLCWTYETSA